MRKINKKGLGPIMKLFLLFSLSAIGLVAIVLVCMQLLQSGYTDKGDCTKISFSFKKNVICYNDGIIEADIERGSDNFNLVGLRFLVDDSYYDFSTSEIPISMGTKTLITTKPLAATGSSIKLKLVPLVGKKLDVPCSSTKEVSVACDSCKHAGMCMPNEGCNQETKKCGACLINEDCDDLEGSLDTCNIETGVCNKA